MYLAEYASAMKDSVLDDEMRRRISNNIYSIDSELGRLETQQAFWQIFEHENETFPSLRLLCLFFYGYGLYGFIVVFAQNTWFVLRAIELPILKI
jgi:hypothetical protein